MSSTIQIQASELQQFASALFQAAGVDESEADTVAESLVSANLCGHDSHGVVRVTEYVDQLRIGELVAGTDLTVLSETASLIVADACLGFGQVQAVRLIERLVPKANEQGIACGTMNNCGHVGRLGEWVERVARKGLAALMAVNDNGVLQCVSPPGGIEPRISTNPIAIAVPTKADPLVLDIATSAVANGKVLVNYNAGEPCPPGWLHDAQGRPTTDPSVRFTEPQGTLVPMGGEHGYKGFGLGLLFDVLVGGLSGGQCPPANESAKLTNNVLLIIWDPVRFSGQSHFTTQAGELIRYVRSCSLSPAVESIRLPNDRCLATSRDRKTHGIPLDRGTWSSLANLAKQIDVTIPRTADVP